MYVKLCISVYLEKPFLENIPFLLEGQTGRGHAPIPPDVRVHHLNKTGKGDTLSYPRCQGSSTTQAGAELAIFVGGCATLLERGVLGAGFFLKVGY